MLLSNVASSMVVLHLVVNRAVASFSDGTMLAAQQGHQPCHTILRSYWPVAFAANDASNGELIVFLVRHHQSICLAFDSSTSSDKRKEDSCPCLLLFMV